MKLRIIEDGFTLPFKASVENGPTLAGTYRPAVPAEVDAYRTEYAAAPAGAEREGVRARFLARHLVTWDAEGAAGPVPASAENLLRVPAPYLSQLEVHVAGYYFTPEAVANEKK